MFSSSVFLSTKNAKDISSFTMDSIVRAHFIAINVTIISPLEALIVCWYMDCELIRQKVHTTHESHTFIVWINKQMGVGRTNAACVPVHKIMSCTVMCFSNNTLFYSVPHYLSFQLVGKLHLYWYFCSTWQSWQSLWGCRKCQCHALRSPYL